jgi:TRAP-type C4-dicarboxylate transport system permease small subunit
MDRDKLGLGEYILAALFGTTILIIAAQVVFRYVFNNSLTWSEELSRYVFSWMVFVGAALAVKSESHIKITFFIERLPPKIGRFLTIVNYFLITLFFITTVILGFLLVSYTSGTYSPALSLPVNCVFYATLPIASLMGIYYSTTKLISFLMKNNPKYKRI